MKTTDITDAMTDVDEALLDRAVSNFHPGRKSRENTKRMIVSVAAGIATISIIALSASKIGMMTKPVVVGENTGSFAVDITSYVFEGKPLSEWAVKAYEAGAGEAEKEGYQRAYDAFMNDFVLPSAVGALRGQGVDCEINDNGLTFFATAAQLESVAFDDLPNWYFDLL